jgi:hypothetical protein
VIWLALLRRFWRPLAVVAVALCIALTIRGYGHRQYEAGYQQARGEDAAALAEAREREIRASAAAHARYEVEHAQTMVAAREPVGVSQLCRPAETGPVRAERAVAGGAPPGAASAGLVRAVPAANHGLADDRRRLLGALAALADEHTAVIRQWQARN